MDECSALEKDLVQLARLAVEEKTEDVRLFVARLVRRYRGSRSSIAEELDDFLKQFPAKSNGNRLLRRHSDVFPLDAESKLSLFKEFDSDQPIAQPLLSQSSRELLEQLICERKSASRLNKKGLAPTRSAIFVGQPGVGKTLTAGWVAKELGMPLLVLDLTAVMSSYLGKTGSNLRSALDYAKSINCVLLLDEIDAIAKRRGDDSDIGELKRLVTVMLQEIDLWPDSSLLLAATNHPDLLDSAVWRRFDLIVDFDLPDHDMIVAAIKRFLGPDAPAFAPWIDILAYAFYGRSFSDIEKNLYRFRRALVLRLESFEELMDSFIANSTFDLPKDKKVELSVLMSKSTKLPQRKISEITGVSRDTIRKYSKNSNKRGR